MSLRDKTSDVSQVGSQLIARSSYSDIAALAFTGRDTAAGKSWEAWMKKYGDKKARGEKDLSLYSEPLEE